MLAFLNKYVFKSRLKLSTELDFRMYEGSEFQSTGTAKANDQSPKMTKVFTEGGSRSSSPFHLMS